MKYRHSFHAGNFADIHKHVTLLALLTSLKRKEKGFAYFETHAGRGAYDLSHPSPEAAGGIGRFSPGEYRADELRNFAALLADVRTSRNQTRAYPGSPLIAAHELRRQDRAVLSEIIPAEARLLERELEMYPRMRVERADGFERLRGWLPPTERRGLVLIDPPYEESGADFERVTAAIVDALQRFSTGIYAAWYPIKDEREVRAWHDGFARAVGCETLASELWVYPRDSKVALNGSGMLIVNPPYQLSERMQIWMPQLQARLDTGHPGGSSIKRLTGPT
ncbi:MAG: 23S rRNA (adenine(2030)-N(6))-methyltransferase RlmJ [Steroidobacteraceae bacterium]